VLARRDGVEATAGVAGSVVTVVELAAFDVLVEDELDGPDELDGVVGAAAATVDAVVSPVGCPAPDATACDAAR
jgi:hypothetical protein